MAGSESRIMTGRGPADTPRVIELDADGYLAGVSTILTQVDLILTYAGTMLTHIPQFGGDIWYVNDGAAAGGDGTTPDTSFTTIGEAVAAASTGDAISVETGTYIENVDLNLIGLELWGEIGATIVGALTLSANSCYAKNVIVAPVGGAVGLLVSGSYCVTDDVHVVGTSAIAVSVTGVYNILNGSKAVNYTATAFNVMATTVHLYRCLAQGADTATRGFYFSNAAADACYAENCASLGNTIAGYEVVTGAANLMFYNCASGSGDGPRIDADNASVWSNYTFDDRVYHTTTFNNTGPTSDNLFRVYGSVIITEFSGEVETVLAADIGNGYIELDDGINTIDVTDSPGPAFNSLPVSSFLHKVDDNTIQIAIEDSSQVRLYEDATKFGEDPNFQVTAKATAASYIRLTYSGAGASGAIHWHCQWRPLTEDGFVVAA